MKTNFALFLSVTVLVTAFQNCGSASFSTAATPLTNADQAGTGFASQPSVASELDPASIIQISYLRSGFYPGPGMPTSISSLVDVDSANQVLRVQISNTSGSCTLPLGTDEYQALADAMRQASLKAAPTAVRIDGGDAIVKVAFADSTASKQYLLIDSDSASRQTSTVLDAPDLENILGRFAMMPCGDMPPPVRVVDGPSTAHL